MSRAPGDSVSRRSSLPCRLRIASANARTQLLPPGGRGFAVRPVDDPPELDPPDVEPDEPDELPLEEPVLDPLDPLDPLPVARVSGASAAGRVRV
jgi:hypothetical protein